MPLQIIGQIGTEKSYTTIFKESLSTALDTDYEKRSKKFK